MTGIKDPTRQRNFRALIASDSWREYNMMLGELEAGEIHKLVDIARTGEVDDIKKQSGVVDGIQRVIVITKKMERQVKGDSNGTAT